MCIRDSLCAIAENAGFIAHNDIGKAVGHQQAGDGNSCASCAVYNNAAVFLFLTDYL